MDLAALPDVLIRDEFEGLAACHPVMTGPLIERGMIPGTLPGVSGQP